MDLADILSLQPVNFKCAKCLALFYEKDVVKFVVPRVANERLTTVEARMRWSEGTQFAPLMCPVCSVQYIPTHKHPAQKLPAYLSGQPFVQWQPARTEQSIDSNFINHCVQLAMIAERIRDNVITPTRGLFQALAVAQSFVHFISYQSITPELIGALLLTGYRISVHGLLPQSQSDLQNTTYKFNTISLNIFDAQLHTQRSPYQQTFVIDGLLAIQGRFTQTTSQIPSTDDLSQSCHVITKPQEVVAVHNAQFSLLWSQQTRYGDRIVMK